jgi:hypothetical protein
MYVPKKSVGKCMKLAAIPFMLVASITPFYFYAMGKDEQFMTEKTSRLVTIREYDPEVDGALYSIQEWETRWGNIKNILDAQRSADTHDSCSDSLAYSADPVKPQSPRSQTPFALQTMNTLSTPAKKDQ